MTNEFKNEIVDFLTERIAEYEGQSFYGRDLSHELTHNENADGCWIMYRKKANEYISNHYEDAKETLQYYRDFIGGDFIDKKLEIGEYTDWEVDYDDSYDEIKMVIKNGNSEVFTFFMLYYGVETFLDVLPCIQKVWNKEFEITPAFIKRFSKELSRL